MPEVPTRINLIRLEQEPNLLLWAKQLIDDLAFLLGQFGSSINVIVGSMGTVTSVGSGFGTSTDPVVPDPFTISGAIDLDIFSLAIMVGVPDAPDWVPLVDTSVGTTPSAQRKVTLAVLADGLNAIGLVAGFGTVNQFAYWDSPNSITSPSSTPPDFFGWSPVTNTIGVGGTPTTERIELFGTTQSLGTYSSTIADNVTAAVAPRFRGRRSRGTLAVPTAIALNDLLATYQFQGHDGSVYALGAEIRAIASETWALIGLLRGTMLDLRTTGLSGPTIASRVRIGANAADESFIRLLEPGGVDYTELVQGALAAALSYRLPVLAPNGVLRNTAGVLDWAAFSGVVTTTGTATVTIEPSSAEHLANIVDANVLTTSLISVWAVNEVDKIHFMVEPQVGSFYLTLAALPYELNGPLHGDYNIQYAVYN